MSAKIIKVEQSATWEKGKYFALIHFAKAGKGMLRSASVNGDNLDYIYPIDAEAFIGKDFSKADAIDVLKDELLGQTDDEISLYDIPVKEAFKEVDPKIRAFRVSKNDDLQPITVFRRASYDDRTTVVARLVSQVIRQQEEDILEAIYEKNEEE